MLTASAGEFGRRIVFDGWQRLAPREITTENVAVVEVDDATVAVAGEWPWPRYQTAQMIELIGQQGPKAIGIDIYFTETDPLAPQVFAERYANELDSSTVEQIAALPGMDYTFGVILGATPSVMARVGTHDTGRSPEEYFFNPEIEGTPPPQIAKYPRVLASIFELDEVAMGHGMVNGAPDPDGVVRRVPLAVQVGEMQAAGFAAELARIAAGAETLRWEDGGMALGDTIMPTDAGGNLKFRMGDIPPESRISALDLFDGKVAPDTFTDKIVLVGVAATGTFDIVATPLESEIYGVLVQAQAVDAMLEGAWLSRPTSMMVAEIGAALLLLALIVAAALLRRNWPLGTAFAFAVILPFVSWIAFTQANLLFDPSRPILVGACAAIALTLTRYSLARAERKRLSAELVEERVRASEQKGELAAARRIQMSMVPGEKTLSRLDQRVEVGGVLEPAKSVGGDFFDAVKINDNLLLFLVGDVTGKGVPAALFMALSKTLSKSNLARAGDGLDNAVAALNFDLMDEADDEMGLTMLVGTINCATGETQLVNAGHENPMVVRKAGSVETLEMVGGPPFCVIDFPYSSEPFQMAPGDTLVIITDGATEAANEGNELFGVDGVVDALKASGQDSAQGRAKHLADEVRLFEGTTDPSDDLTIFALRFLGERG